MRYSELAESAAVMARGIKAEAGWLAFAEPMPHGLDIRFPPGQAQVLEIRFADGRSKRWHAVARGDGSYNGIELPWKPEWRDAEVTQLGRAPGREGGVSTCRTRWAAE